MLCHGRTHMVLMPYHFFFFFFFFLNFFVATVGDITTILGSFFLRLCQKLCKSYGEKISAFLVTRFIHWGGNLQSLPIKDGAEINIFQTQFDLHKRITAQALLLPHASPEVLPPQCPKVSSTCSRLLEMVALVLTTAMGPLTAIISTWRGCKLLWTHGTWVHEISWSFVPWPVPWAFCR